MIAMALIEVGEDGISPAAAGRLRPAWSPSRNGPVVDSCNVVTGSAAGGQQFEKRSARYLNQPTNPHDGRRPLPGADEFVRQRTPDPQHACGLPTSSMEGTGATTSPGPSRVTVCIPTISFGHGGPAALTSSTSSHIN